MNNAKCIVKWFNDNGLLLENSFNGNLRVNKLLVFAQLISLAKYDKLLYKEEMYAFKHGLVVEEIRQSYKNNYVSFKNSLMDLECNFTDEELDVLNTTNHIFGKLNANILSDLTHEFQFWKNNYNRSNINGYKDKELAKVNLFSLSKEYTDDFNKLQLLIKTSEDQYNDDMVSLEIKGTTFYYNPKETALDESLIKELEQFPAEDNSYSFYLDINQGLVIY